MKNRSFTFFMTLPDTACDTEGGGEGGEGKASTPRGGKDGKGAVQMSYISDPNSKVSNPRKVPAFDALFTADRTANKIVVRLSMYVTRSNVSPFVQSGARYIVRIFRTRVLVDVSVSLSVSLSVSPSVSMFLR